MKHTITLFFCLVASIALANDVLLLDNVIIKAGDGNTNGLTVGECSETGEIYTNYLNVTKIYCDRDSGIHVAVLPDGSLRFYNASHWAGIFAGGETNYPEGAQDIQFRVSSEVSEITWDTNTTPWTIIWPLSEGEQGPRGYPGFTFGVYNSTGWSTSESYETNQWFLYGGDGYGVLENFTPTAETTPSDYTLSGELLLLYTSGEDGADGENGAGMIPSGNWSSSVGYPSMASVRYGSDWYYTLSGSSNQMPGVASNWLYFIGDGASGAAAIITSNAVWAGQFDYTLGYPSNSIVYYPENPYGGYRVIKDYEESIGGLPGPVRLNNTEYFKKLWHYARDGSAGSPGEDGQQGADGAGNMWYRTAGWDDEFEFTNAGIVVVHNDETYISKAYSYNKEPGVVPGWTNYWKVGAGKGVNGGLYKWSLGYDDTVQYTNYDVVVESNIAWLCTSSAQAEPPWLTPDKWEDMFKPGYITLAQITARNYAQYGTYTNGEIVNYGGGAYLCTNAVTNAVSSSPASDYFYYWIHKGDQGIQGPAGITTVVYTNMVISTTVVQQITQEYQGIELTNNLNANGYTISNAVFQGDGSGLTGIDAGGATNIQAGSSDSYNEATRTLTWNTGAVQATTGGTGTNIGFGLTGNGDDDPLRVDSSVVVTGVRYDIGGSSTTNNGVITLTPSGGEGGGITNIVINGTPGTTSNNMAYATVSGGGTLTNEVDPKVLASLEGYEADYYVAKWGDDANAGTNWSKPFLTIQAAVTNGEATFAPFRVLVNDGVYTNTITFTTYSNEIAISAVHPHDVTINAGGSVGVSGGALAFYYNYKINGIRFVNTRIDTVALFNCIVESVTNSSWIVNRSYALDTLFRNLESTGLSIFYSVSGNNRSFSHSTIMNCTGDSGKALARYINPFDCEIYNNSFTYGFQSVTAFGRNTYENNTVDNSYYLSASGYLGGDIHRDDVYNVNCDMLVGGDLTVSGDIQPTTGNYFTFPSGAYFDDDGTNVFYVGSETSQLNKPVLEYDGTNFYHTVNGTNYYVQVSTNKPTY